MSTGFASGCTTTKIACANQRDTCGFTSVCQSFIIHVWFVYYLFELLACSTVYHCCRYHNPPVEIGGLDYRLQPITASLYTIHNVHSSLFIWINRTICDWQLLCLLSALHTCSNPKCPAKKCISYIAVHTLAFKTKRVPTAHCNKVLLSLDNFRRNHCLPYW